MSSKHAPFVGYYSNGVIYRAAGSKREALVRLVYASEEIRDVIVAALRKLVVGRTQGGLMEKRVEKLFCPWCGKRHVDEGEFAERPHHTHRCVADAFGHGCGREWRLVAYVFGAPPSESELEALALWGVSSG